MQITRKHFIAPVLLLLVTLTLIAGVNRFVDPYGFFGSPVIEGFNQYKFRFTGPEPETKLRAFSRQLPPTVILGTSRAAIGISARSPHWHNAHVYNLGYAGAGIRSLGEIADYVFRQPSSEKAVLMLDFFSFNIYSEANQSDHFRYQRIQSIIPESGVALHDTLLLPHVLLSTQALKDSLFTIQKQHMTRRYLDPQGNWIGPGIGHFRPQASLFKDMEAEALDIQYFSAPFRRFALGTPGQSTLADFRRIIQSAHQHQIDLSIGLSPRHVRLHTLMHTAGLDALHGQWKTSLAQINEEEAKRFHQQPFPLIDFSGISGYTTEPLPEAGDKTTKLQWFLDPGHYTPELGEIILQQLLANNPDGQFGRALTTDNASALHRNDQQVLQRWLEAHPDIADAAKAQWQSFLRKAPTASVESPGL